MPCATCAAIVSRLSARPGMPRVSGLFLSPSRPGAMPRVCSIPPSPDPTQPDLRSNARKDGTMNAETHTQIRGSERYKAGVLKYAQMGYWDGDYEPKDT